MRRPRGRTLLTLAGEQLPPSVLEEAVHEGPLPGGGSLSAPDPSAEVLPLDIIDIDGETHDSQPNICRGASDSHRSGFGTVFAAPPCASDVEQDAPHSRMEDGVPTSSSPVVADTYLPAVYHGLPSGREASRKKAEDPPHAPRKCRGPTLKDSLGLDPLPFRSPRKRPVPFPCCSFSDLLADAEPANDRDPAASVARDVLVKTRLRVQWSEGAPHQVEPAVTAQEEKLSSAKRLVLDAIASLRAASSVMDEELKCEIETLKAEAESERKRAADLEVRLSSAVPLTELESVRNELSRTATEWREKYEQAVLCQICYDLPRNVLLLPCTHSLYCKGCIDRISGPRACPACRSPIAGQLIMNLDSCN